MCEVIEKRLWDVMKNGEINNKNEFPHWIANGWFILVRKTKIELWHSCEYDARKASKILEGVRDDQTYQNFATALGL